MRSASAAPSRPQYSSGMSFCQKANARSSARGFVSRGRSVVQELASFRSVVSVTGNGWAVRVSTTMVPLLGLKCLLYTISSAHSLALCKRWCQVDTKVARRRERERRVRELFASGQKGRGGGNAGSDTEADTGNSNGGGENRAEVGVAVVIQHGSQ